MERLHYTLSKWEGSRSKINLTFRCHSMEDQYLLEIVLQHRVAPFLSRRLFTLLGLSGLEVRKINSKHNNNSNLRYSTHLQLRVHSTITASRFQRYQVASFGFQKMSVRSASSIWFKSMHQMNRFVEWKVHTSSQSLISVSPTSMTKQYNSLLMSSMRESWSDELYRSYI